MDVIADLEHACANTGRLVANVRADQWSAPTPCTEWNVRELVNHTTWTLTMFGNATRDADAPPRDADLLGDDPVAAYERAAAAAVAGWRALASFDSEITIPIGALPARLAVSINLIDVYVHGWDLAAATGQDAALDEGIAQRVLDVSRAFLPEVGRRAAFAEEVQVATDAPAGDQLVAYLGRRPASAAALTA
jgi:uncharacterized protein (TIGR03086 family)